MEHETPPPGITAEEWTATPIAVRHLVGALLTVLAQQQHQLAQLQAHLADLDARLNQHSQNSSKPPSSDPPSAPPRPARAPRGRSTGAQPGHPRHDRPDPQPDQIDTVRDHYPHTCPHCQTSVSDTRRDACAVRTQYVWELPLVQPHITAHHYPTVCCPACGDLVTAQRPDDLPPGAFGPRTAAVASLLHGRYRISQREVGALLEDLFALPLSVGSVVTLQATVSAALAPVYTEVQAQVQAGGRGSLGAWAADWLGLSELVFRLWYAFRGGTIDRAQLQAAMEPIQTIMHALLERGTRRLDEAEAISQELLAHWDALWTFVRVAGVEPTNNAAEQALR